MRSDQCINTYFRFFNLQKKLCFLKAFVHGVEKLLKKVSKNINFPFIENSILIEKLQYLNFCAKIYFWIENLFWRENSNF